tara:strand:+ start:7578 stop:8204 length:627 start_codon:yes stop_codon:yes gene_type:complete
MKNLVGFIYCETNGLHKTVPKKLKEGNIINIIPPVKNTFKNMFNFARLVVLNYSIGYYEENNFIETKKERLILKPKSINFNEEAMKYHGISMKKAYKKGVDPVEVMKKFANDFKYVNFIVSHNVEFHIKTIQCELMRSCVIYDFSKKKIIDIISFNHELKFPSLKKLSLEILGNSYENKSAKYNLTIIRKVFIQLYKDFEISLTISKE